MSEREYWEEYDAIHNAKSERDARRRLRELDAARDNLTTRGKSVQ
jgi:hypothetical protein